MKREVFVCQRNSLDKIIKIKLDIEVNVEDDQGSALLVISENYGQFTLSFFYTKGDKIALNFIVKSCMYFRQHIYDKELLEDYKWI